MTCKKCNGTNFNTSVVCERHSAGCITFILALPLIFIPVVGWIIMLFIITRGKNKTRTYMVCNNCGKRALILTLADKIGMVISIIVSVIILIAAWPIISDLFNSL